MKTVEATFAVVLFLVFLAFLTLNQYKAQPELVPQDVTLIQDTVFNEIQTNPVYRANALSLEQLELNLFINSTVPERYNHNITVCEVGPCQPLAINTKEEIYVDTLVISNTTKTAYLTLYLWQE
ncbi:MAG: hypothetical protein KKH88_03780 [Nanoarchaeota archaeon]|nr:hypothetical protein [Nanoarchaeota archaeon]MBU2406598.1 hypothetical protein [Nanoarchaeota archaeon]MBU2420621.1 hypothetical protein [Nanoarchaeota archaeon]MBU2474931.1 hypothetical protein [Nanoarchaeota archaeon]MBU3941019.1 hypothetical protein [Nanoarchaeota archaeon]